MIDGRDKGNNSGLYFSFPAIMGNCSRYPGSGCIVVEDAKVMARGDKHYPVIDLTSISPKTSEGTQKRRKYKNLFLKSD